MTTDFFGEVRRIGTDVLRGPSLGDTVEAVILGGTLGAVLGYAVSKNREEALRYAEWGAGLTVGGQFLLFHMLRPALRARVGENFVGADPTPPPAPSSLMPATGCPEGSYWSDWYGACVPNIPPPPPPTPFPGSLEDWEALHT